ncbi:MAG: hypothetical protein ACRDBY_13435 [Cetobacterium sp.]
MLKKIFKWILIFVLAVHLITFIVLFIGGAFSNSEDKVKRKEEVKIVLNQKREQEEAHRVEMKRQNEIEEKFKDYGGVDFINNKAFVEIGYYKSPMNHRAFTVYTESTSKEDLITYARKKQYTEGGQTVVHFFNNEEHVPINTMVTDYNIGMWLKSDEMDPLRPYMIGSYQKRLKGDEYWWDGSVGTYSDISDEVFDKLVKKIN